MTWLVVARASVRHDGVASASAAAGTSDGGGGAGVTDARGVTARVTTRQHGIVSRTDVG